VQGGADPPKNEGLQRSRNIWPGWHYFQNEFTNQDSTGTARVVHRNCIHELEGGFA
jgi:hypothetical protein